MRNIFCITHVVLDNPEGFTYFSQSTSYIPKNFGDKPYNGLVHYPLKNGWENIPKVLLKVRQVDDTYIERAENEWPLARTDWTKLYINSEKEALQLNKVKEASKVSYQSLGEGLTFLTDPYEQTTEITGPLSCKLFISSTTNEADLFLVLRLFDPSMNEIFFIGANDPEVPLTVGWLRASHRKLDVNKSKPWKPYLTHDELQPLKPHEIYEVEIEILPTCIQIPPGYRLGLSIRGTDFVNPSTGKTSEKIVHKHRLKKMKEATVTLHVGEHMMNYLLVPYIPRKSV